MVIDGVKKTEMFRLFGQSQYKQAIDCVQTESNPCQYKSHTRTLIF